MTSSVNEFATIVDTGDGSMYFRDERVLVKFCPLDDCGRMQLYWYANQFDQKCLGWTSLSQAEIGEAFRLTKADQPYSYCMAGTYYFRAGHCLTIQNTPRTTHGLILDIFKSRIRPIPNPRARSLHIFLSDDIRAAVRNHLSLKIGPLAD